MGEFVIKLPDVGEGVAEAELVEWLVKEGANVREDEPLAAVMTDKATVEIPSPVEGKVKWLGARIGEIVAVGAPIIKLEVDGPGNAKAGAVEAKPEPRTPAKEAKSANGAQLLAQPAQSSKPAKASKPAPAAKLTAMPAPATRKEGDKPLAAPAVRKRALDSGVDLRRVPGSGPAGRVLHADLDAYFESGGTAARPSARGRADMTVTEVPVIGLRRKIAEKMTISRSRIADIVYVEEIDVTALEELRAKMNAGKKPDQPKLTILPFLMRAVARAIEDQPQMNAHFDDEAGVVKQYGGVHTGIAAQTEGGLMVPVVRHVEAKGLWECAAEAQRVADAAKSGTATREELSGSTITITSLGALGGIVTTPVINHPEVAIVGPNKIRILPHWDGVQFVPRKMMNLSSAFDHRVIDGWNAAVFVRKIKTLLEAPAMIFIED